MIFYKILRMQTSRKMLVLELFYLFQAKSNVIFVWYDGCFLSPKGTLQGGFFHNKQS